MIQGQIDGILIFLGIFRQHCRIGVILKIYRQFQCLLQKTQTVVLYLQSMRFQYNPVLLINDTGNRNADPQQFLFRTASLQEFRYLLFHLHTVGKIRGELQTHPDAFFNLGTQIDQYHFQMIGTDDYPHCSAIGLVDTDALRLPATGGLILPQFCQQLLGNQFIHIRQNRRHTDIQFL